MHEDPAGLQYEFQAESAVAYLSRLGLWVLHVVQISGAYENVLLNCWIVDDMDKGRAN